MEPDPNTQPIPPTEPPIPEKHTSPILPWLLILAFAGVASYFSYQNWQLKQQLSHEPISAPTPIPSPAEASAQEGTANWKTYTDPNGVYSFKYPQSYTLGHYATDNSPLLINNRIDWGITQHPAGGCRGDCPIITNTQDIIINNYSAKRYEGWIGSIGGEMPQSYLRYEIKQPSTNNYFVITLWELDRTSVAQKNYSQERKVGSISKEDIKIFDQILSTFKFIPQTQINSTCKSVNLNIGLTLPNNTWQCNVNNFGKDEVGWDGDISLTSPLFTIEISTLGRGPYCGDGPDPENLCKETLYYKNDKFGLTTFTYKGEDKELFGGFLIGRKPWISVTYTNMETQKLTDSQKKELFQLLNSVTEVN